MALEPPNLGFINVLRTYPTTQRAPWLFMLLETIADFSHVRTREELAEVVAIRSRQLFGIRIRAVILPIAADAMSMIPSKANHDVPDIFATSRVTTPYVAGQIFEIRDYLRYVEERPVARPWYDAGFRYVVSAAFSPHAHVRGYVSFLHLVPSDYSDDELTLMQMLAALVGFELDRIDRLAA